MGGLWRNRLFVKDRLKFFIALLTITSSSVITGVLSFALHDPDEPALMGNFGFKYNDIIYGVLNPRFHPASERIRDYWYRHEIYDALVRGERRNPVPYVDYFLEYPPVVGLLYYVSTHIGLESVKDCSLRTCYKEFEKTNYVVHGVTLILFHVLTSITVALILRAVGLNPFLTMIYVFSPSTLIYLVYNWDVICIFFATLGLYLFIKKRFILSAVSFSLSILTKLIPILFVASILIIALFNYLKGRLTGERFREIAFRFILTLVVFTSIPYALLFTVNPRCVTDFIEHHRRWYCENCIYQLIDRNIFSETHRILSLTAVTLGLIAVSLINSGGLFKTPSALVKNCFQINALYLVFGYVSSPQMFLLASPLACVVLKGYLQRLFIKADVLNAMGILLFFKDRELRLCLKNLGFEVDVEFNPWIIPSLTQIVWLTKSFLLLVILAITLLLDYRFIKKLRGYEGE